MMPSASIRVFKSRDLLELKAAEEIIRIIGIAIKDRGTCSVALSGGETPRHIYARLATEPSAKSLNWSNVHLFFGDERSVPPTDPLSNFGMVERELISHIDIPASNIHRIMGEIRPDDAARQYTADLKTAFAREDVRFDLFLLGLGEDGHTASIFPRTSSVEELHDLVCSTYVPQLETWRVSLTLRTINHARCVLFLVSGAKKARVLGRVLNAERPIKDLPATMVGPNNGTLQWMVDADAAAAADIMGRQGLNFSE